MLKVTPGISKKILVISIVALFLVSMVFFVSPGKVYGDGGSLSSAKAIYQFTFVYGVNSQLTTTMVGIVDESAKTISVNVPLGTIVTALKPTISTTSKKLPSSSRVSPISGVANNFATPQKYIVTAEDNSTQEYTVTVTLASNTDKAITFFKFNNPLSIGTINEDAHTIAVNVPYGTIVNMYQDWLNEDYLGTLFASVSIAGTSVIPQTGNDRTNYTYPVDYTVTAADGSHQVYTVTVTVAAPLSTIVAPASTPPKPLTAEEQTSLNLSIAEQVNLYGASNIGFTKMLYDNILGRAAESEGLSGWATDLNDGTITLGSVVYNFVFSKELELKISSASPEEFITFLYKNVFNREQDSEGYNGWLSAMKNGMSKEDVLLHFTESDEFKNICTMFGLKP